MELFEEMHMELARHLSCMKVLELHCVALMQNQQTILMVDAKGVRHFGPKGRLAMEVLLYESITLKHWEQGMKYHS